MSAGRVRLRAVWEYILTWSVELCATSSSADSTRVGSIPRPITWPHSAASRKPDSNTFKLCALSALQGDTSPFRRSSRRPDPSEICLASSVWPSRVPLVTYREVQVAIRCGKFSFDLASMASNQPRTLVATGFESRLQASESSKKEPTASPQELAIQLYDRVQ